MIRLERIPWLWDPLFILLYSADSVQCNCVDFFIRQPLFLFQRDFPNLETSKNRPIGQIAGCDMATSPINTGDVAISNL